MAIKIEGEEKKPFDPTNPTGGPNRLGTVPLPSFISKEYEGLPLLEGTKFSDSSAFLRSHIAATQDLGLAAYLNDGDLTNAFMDAFGLPLDEATRLHHAATTQGIPEDAAFASKEHLLAYQKASEVAKRLLERDPETKELRFPYVARLAMRSKMLAATVLADEEALTKLEKEIADLGRKQRDTVGGLITRFDSSQAWLGLVKMRETVAGITRGTIQGTEILRALQATELNRISLGEGEDSLTDWLKAIRKSDFLAPLYLPRTTFLEELPTDIIGAAPQAALAFAGAVPASILMAAYIGGSTEEELEQLGVDDPERRRMAGLLNAALQIVPDYLTFGKFSQIGKGGSKSASWAFLKYLGMGAFSEMTDSYPEYTSLLWGLADKEGTTSGERARLFIENFGATTVQGVQEAITLLPSMMLGGFTHLAHTIRRNGMLEVHSKWWERVMKTSEKSKMRKENPEQFVEHMGTMIAEEDIDPDIYISHDALLQAVDNNRSEVDRIAEELGITDQMKDAEILGHDLKIDKAKAAQVLAGTELGVAIHNDLRFEKDGKTLGERAEEAEAEAQQKEAYIKEIGEYYKQLKKENKVPESVLLMREQLMKKKKEGGLGWSAAKADANLVLLMAQVKSDIVQTGETLEEAFKKHNIVLEIGGEAVTVEELLKQAEGEAIKGAITFSDTQTLIQIFESADASTFQHEIMHFRMNNMKNIIDAGLGDEQYRKDYQTLLDFAGGKLDRVGQEKLAEAFGIYLSEGEAPSVELMGAFSRFRKWLTNLYKNLRMVKGVGVNDEIRSVFDRLLATEEEIRDAKSLYDGVVELTDFIKLTQKQKEDLAAKKKKAVLTAEEKLDKKIKKDLNSFIRSEGGKSGINERAAEEVDAEPVYKAMVAIEEKGGLSIKSVKELYGEKAYQDLKVKGLTKRKGTATVAEIAIEQGYESEGVLLRELVEAESRGKAIQMKAKEILAAAEQNIRSSLEAGGLSMGEEALHTDARLEFLIAEANLLAEELERQAGPEAEEARLKRLEAKVLKVAAAEALLDMRTSEATRPDRFALAELKFGRRYEKLLSEGDLVGAYDARNRQLLHHAMVQEAIRMREEKVRRRKRLKPKAFESSLKNTDNLSAEAATEIAYAFGLSDIKPRIQHDVVDLEEINEGLSYATSDWIKRKVTPKGSKNRSDHWRNLTMGEFLDVTDAIQGIINIGKDKWVVFQDEIHETPDAASAASVETMRELGTKKYRKDKFWDRWLKGPLQKLASMGTQVEGMLDRADGHSFKLTKTPGIMGRLFRLVVDREAYNNDQKTKLLGEAAPHLDVLYKAKKRIEAILGRYTHIDGVRDLNPEGWTVNERLTVLAYMGNEKSYNALKNGWGLTDAELQLIVRVFEKQEMAAVQGIWDVTNTIFPLLDEVEMNMYDRHLIKEEAQPLTVIDVNGETVKLPGGYFPMSQFDYTKSDRAADIKEKMAWADRQSAVHRPSKTRDSARHARVEKHSLPPMLDIRVWTTHISDVLRTISHSEVMRDFDRVTLNEEWRNMFTEKFGDEGYKQLRKWAQYQAKPELKNKLPNWLENQRRLAVISALAYNIKVGIQQRFSLIHGVRAIGLKWVMEGYSQTDIRNATLGITGASYDEVLSFSPYMRLRSSTVYRDLKEITDEMDPFAKSIEIGGRRFTAKNVQTFGFQFLLMNDRAVVEPLWRGAYSKYVSEIATSEMTPDRIQKNAVEYADAVIREGQPGSAVFDQNAFQRGEGWLRLFTNFMSYTSRFGTMVTTHHDAFWVDKVMSNEQYIKHIFNDVLLNRYMVMLLTSALTTGGLPEWWDWFFSPVESLTSWVPVGRDLTRAIRYGFRDGIGQTPVFEGINRGVEAWKSLSDWALDDGQFSSFLWDIGKMTEFQLGVKPLGVIEDMDKKYKAVTGQKKKGTGRRVKTRRVRKR